MLFLIWNHLRNKQEPFHQETPVPPLSIHFFPEYSPLRLEEKRPMTDELSRIIFGICLIASALVINLQLP